jgi:hypothetical protein
MVKTDAERILGDTVRQDALNKLSILLSNSMMELGLFKSCMNCEYWIEGSQNNPIQKCKLFNARPPTQIIVSGCEKHSDNIPF